MKYEKIVLSVPAFKKIAAQDLPLPIAYRLKKMTSRIDDELVFFRMRHGEIMTSDVADEEKGSLIAELMNFEIDWDPEPIRIPFDTDIRLSCADLSALDGLVEFYEEDPDENDSDHRER